jgi:hypothetical protein
VTAEHKELEAELAGLCGQLGHWCWVSRHNSMQETAGIVDGLVFGRHALMFAELKSEDGRRTRAQMRVAAWLVNHGYVYRCYRRADFDNGTVRRDLEEL